MGLGSGAVPSYPSSPILHPPKLDAHCTGTQRCRNYTASALTVHSPVPQTKASRKFSLTVTRPKVEELTRRHEEAHQPPGLPLWVALGPTQLAVAGLWGGSQKGGTSGKNRVQSSLPLLVPTPTPPLHLPLEWRRGHSAVQPRCCSLWVLAGCSQPCSEALVALQDAAFWTGCLTVISGTKLALGLLPHM